MLSYKHIKLLQTLEAVHGASLTCILAISPYYTRAIDLLVLSFSVLLFPTPSSPDWEEKNSGLGTRGAHGGL